MMKDYQTKDVKDPQVTLTAASVLLNRYHFAGDGIYQPISIEAATITQATELWKLKRIPLVAPSAEPAKVESPETKNE